MDIAKQNTRKIIQQTMGQMSKDFIDHGIVPTDKDIKILAAMFYDRDKNEGGFDMEMFAVQRGIEQGMGLMKQIMGK